MAETNLEAGYLNGDTKVFYIKDRPDKTFEAHYHNFHKLLILISGDLTYAIEGQQYRPEPGDILLVPAGEVHQPKVRNTSDYERIIFYISQEFLDAWSRKNKFLVQPFELAASQKKHLLQFREPMKGNLQHIYQELIGSFDQKEDSSMELYRQLKLLELLLLIARPLQFGAIYRPMAESVNPLVQKALEYIHEHLQDQDISIDKISGELHITRTYLMHIFKDETGYSVIQYIIEKRLFLTTSLIRSGLSVKEACQQSGFKNYAAYYHAQKRYNEKMKG